MPIGDFGHREMMPVAFFVQEPGLAKQRIFIASMPVLPLWE